MFEAKAPNISTFHGVFREMSLKSFTEADMEDVYTALSCYDIDLSSGGKKRLTHYTGGIPYLCCMFGERMVAHADTRKKYGDKEIDGIFRECLPQIDAHYNRLRQSLEEDGHIEPIFYLSIGALLTRSMSQRHLENLMALGTLNKEEKDGKVFYYAYTKDFMTYFRLLPLDLPAWETMTACEKKSKKFFPRSFRCWIRPITTICPEPKGKP